MNSPQFNDTLYELEVLDNFRRSSYEIDLAGVGESRTPDMTGTILNDLTP